MRTPLKTLRIVRGKKLTVPTVAYTYHAKTAALSYQSSNTRIATVSSTGVIKAKRTGKVTITVKPKLAKAPGLKISVRVVKKPVGLKGFTVRSRPKTLARGKAAFITVKLKNSSATGTRATFKSSKKSVASVDKAGRVKALKKGTAKITVRIAGKTKSFTVKVK
jgi:alpha-amylase